MSAKITNIKDISTSDIIYPVTKTNAVLDANGTNVEDRLTNIQNQLTPTAWQFATPNADAVQQGTCEFCKVGKIVHCYIDNFVIKSGVSGTGSGLVNLFTGLPTSNHTIIFIIPDQVSNSSNAIRAKLDGGTISLHWSDTASFGNTGVHHNLIFSYVEA